MKISSFPRLWATLALSSFLVDAVPITPNKSPIQLSKQLVRKGVPGPPLPINSERATKAAPHFHPHKSEVDVHSTSQPFNIPSEGKVITLAEAKPPTINVQILPAAQPETPVSSQPATPIVTLEPGITLSIPIVPKGTPETPQETQKTEPQVPVVDQTEHILKDIVEKSVTLEQDAPATETKQEAVVEDVVINNGEIKEIDIEVTPKQQQSSVISSAPTVVTIPEVASQDSGNTLLKISPQINLPMNSKPKRRRVNRLPVLNGPIDQDFSRETAGDGSGLNQGQNDVQTAIVNEAPAVQNAKKAAAIESLMETADALDAETVKEKRSMMTLNSAVAAVQGQKSKKSKKTMDYGDDYYGGGDDYAEYCDEY